MKRITIRNLGPLTDLSIELGRVNIIVGMQSSGKSCVLKTACFCSWVEKRLQLAQKPNGFGIGSGFIDTMAHYSFPRPSASWSIGWLIAQGNTTIISSSPPTAPTC